jgi:hypothetical protein
LLTFFDFALLPIYLILIISFHLRTKSRLITENPIYEFYVRGLSAKITGGIIFCLVYTLYYEGGDTTAYFLSGVYLFNLFFKNPEIWLKIMMNDLTWENYYFFDGETGFPVYFRDPQSFTVVRLTCLFQFFSLKSYLLTTTLLATVCYQGIWRFFTMFCELYPSMRRSFYYSILLVPSILFWGSGILKDSYTLTAACWFTYSFYRIFINRKSVFINIIMMILSAWLLIQIKPYIILALIPGSLIWLLLHYTTQLKDFGSKIILAPIVGLLIFMGGYLTISTIQTSLKQYSTVGKVIEKAIATQNDLKQEYYQGNSFDIGTFDNSISGVLAKFPAAVTAGLFRPFLWESKNLVMIFAGLENSFMLGLTIFILLRIGPMAFIRATYSNPLVLFSIIFSLFFSFSVGLSTANFGALVRYKIPAIPFYISGLMIVYNYYVKRSDDSPEVANLGQEVSDRVLPV